MRFVLLQQILSCCTGCISCLLFYIHRDNLNNFFIIWWWKPQQTMSPCENLDRLKTLRWEHKWRWSSLSNNITDHDNIRLTPQQETWNWYWQALSKHFFLPYQTWSLFHLICKWGEYEYSTSKATQKYLGIHNFMKNNLLNNNLLP